MWSFRKSGYRRYNKDFYFGFYCTLYPEQAIRWAIRFDGIGYLNEYSYTPDDSLKVKASSRR